MFRKCRRFSCQIDDPKIDANGTRLGATLPPAAAKNVPQQWSTLIHFVGLCLAQLSTSWRTSCAHCCTTQSTRRMVPSPTKYAAFPPITGFRSVAHHSVNCVQLAILEMTNFDRQLRIDHQKLHCSRNDLKRLGGWCGFSNINKVKLRLARLVLGLVTTLASI